MSIRRLSIAIGALALFGVCAEAQGRGRGKGKGEANVTVIFTDAHRGRVQEYFVAHPLGVKPLPPGIAKNIARGKPLPPGIAKRAVPREVLMLLPRPEPDVAFVVVGDMVLAERKGVVLDVMLRIAR